MSRTGCLMAFPDQIERYLAELRSGASETQALIEADADSEALARWRRNKAFREARDTALTDGKQYATTDGGWVGTPLAGSNMTVWMPVLDRTPPRTPIVERPVRRPAARPWQAARSVFSGTASPDSVPG
jgi:hypothetical protein